MPMSNNNDKVKNSKRRQKDENAINKQLNIIKQRSHFSGDSLSTVEKQPHRLVKHHAMDCGNPQCFLCGNPRRTHKDRLTAQEKRMLQDIDTPNGFNKGDDDVE